MQTENTDSYRTPPQELTDVLIRIGLIAFLAFLCYKIFSPFMGLILWALILAVVLYPLHQKLARYLGGRENLAATLIVVAGLLVIGTPTVLMSSAFVDNLHGVYEKIHTQSAPIKPPPPSVAQWPVVGKKVFSLWTQAADNLPALLEQQKPQLEKVARAILAAVASTANGMLQFLGSLILAGIMMAYGRAGSEAMKKITSRLTSPEKGPRLHNLSTLVIRSVAMGVLGMAFLQALLVGIGLVWADIPAAGVITIVLVFLGIAQMPAIVVTLPAILYLWSTGDNSTMNVVHTVYLLIAGMADGFIKPLVLGRGVDIPMPVVLLGALGGMVVSGIIGLFIGAVLLSLGYKIFMEWVDDGTTADEAPATAPEAPANAAADLN